MKLGTELEGTLGIGWKGLEEGSYGKNLEWNHAAKNNLV